MYGNELGTVKDIIDTLESFDMAYKAFILFNLAISDASNNNGFGAHELMQVFSRRSMFFEKYALYNVDEYILPREELIVTRINFNSPGFWEMIGSLNPLVQIREYLNDRHNRKKDKRQWEIETEKALLENKQLELENQKLALQNIEYSIEISMKKLALAREVTTLLQESGCSEQELREFTNGYVNVLKRLEDCIEDERITGIDLF